MLKRGESIPVSFSPSLHQATSLLGLQRLLKPVAPCPEILGMRCGTSISIPTTAFPAGKGNPQGAESPFGCEHLLRELFPRPAALLCTRPREQRTGHGTAPCVTSQSGLEMNGFFHFPREERSTHPLRHTHTQNQ